MIGSTRAIKLCSPCNIVARLLVSLSKFPGRSIAQRSCSPEPHSAVFAFSAPEMSKRGQDSLRRTADWLKCFSIQPLQPNEPGRPRQDASRHCTVIVPRYSIDSILGTLTARLPRYVLLLEVARPLLSISSPQVRRGSLGKRAQCYYCHWRRQLQGEGRRCRGLAPEEPVRLT